jgi:hypothetical protein
MPIRITAISLFLFFYSLSLATISTAGDVKQGDKIKIITPGTVARLCPAPSCGQNQHILRIPQGTVLKVERTSVISSGIISAIWCEVSYNGKSGWVSIYDTDKQ